MRDSLRGLSADFETSAGTVGGTSLPDAVAGGTWNTSRNSDETATVELKAASRLGACDSTDMDTGTD